MRPRIIGHMVTRNEIGRYLEPSVHWLEHLTGANPIVYDDQSDDGTFECLQKLDVTCARRPNGVPSFAANEGLFRWMAWQYMEDVARPTRSDWVLVIDADEFVVVEDSDADVRSHIWDLIEWADQHSFEAVTFRVHEVFDVDDDGALVRTDGFWGSITACRLVRWRPGGQFHDKREASGSVPAHWGQHALTSDTLGLLHFGYATAADRQERYDRYASGTGHSAAHIRSILERPMLRHWRGTSLDPLGLPF